MTLTAKGRRWRDRALVTVTIVGCWVWLIGCFVIGGN